MTLHKFLESLYVATNAKLQKEYSVYDHAKTLATEDIRNVQRKLFKLISYIQLLGHFILVKFNLVKPPMTAQEFFNEANKVVESKKEN